MTKPSEMQITYLNDLLNTYEVFKPSIAQSMRNQINAELASDTLTQVGAVNFIKELRFNIDRSRR